MPALCWRQMLHNKRCESTLDISERWFLLTYIGYSLGGSSCTQHVIFFGNRKTHSFSPRCFRILPFQEMDHNNYGENLVLCVEWIYGNSSSALSMNPALGQSLFPCPKKKTRQTSSRNLVRKTAEACPGNWWITTSKN